MIICHLQTFPRPSPSSYGPPSLPLSPATRNQEPPTPRYWGGLLALSFELGVFPLSPMLRVPPSALVRSPFPAMSSPYPKTSNSPPLTIGLGDRPGNLTTHSDMRFVAFRGLSRALPHLRLVPLPRHNWCVYSHFRVFPSKPLIHCVFSEASA